MAARNIKKNSLSYKHFTEGLRTATLDPQILCVSGPSTYLKLKVEEWYNKKSPSENQVVKLLAEAVSTSDLDDMLYQDSIFEPSSYYIIRKCDRQSEIAQALRKIQDAKQIKNTILLVSQNRSFGANIQKELTRLQMKTIPCFEPNLYELPKFILSLAKRHQLNIDQSGAGAILEALGTDLPLIENELKGLSLIFADREGELITRDDLSP